MQPPDVLSATKRWTLDTVDFAVVTALGVTIQGRFDRVGGSYDGTTLSIAVDAASLNTGNGIWDGLLRSADSRALAEHPQVRFTSTAVRELGNGALRVEGRLEAGGKVEPVAFDAAVKQVDGGLRLEAVVTIDRQQLGQSADRLAVFLPANGRVTLHFRP